MSKIAMIYHSVDLDGWMSAAIVKHWFITNNRQGYKIYRKGNDKDIEDDIFSTLGAALIPSITFIGYNYGQPIPDLSEYNKVIMCDINFKTKEDGVKTMIDLYKRLGDNFIWIDHHLSAMNDNVERNTNKIMYAGIRGVTHAACELTWKYFFPNEAMPEIVRLLGRYDCFGHKGTDEEQTVLEFQYGARASITNYDEAYERLTKSILDNQKGAHNILETIILNNGISIYKYLCQEAKQTYATRFELRFNDFKFAAINKNRFNPVNFGIDYHADGYDGVACFWYEQGKWKFSIYNDNSLVDCSMIAKSFGGGGHRGASGFVINNIEEFIKDYTNG